MDKKIGAIANGINIDHIRQGNAWYIIKYLKLNRQYPVGVGLNLVSKRMGFKDLVKIENYHLTEEQVQVISVFAYGATYSEIENYAVIRKMQLKLPESITDLIVCPNHRCISHQYKSLFKFATQQDKVIANCHYCNHSYDLAQLNKFNI